ncbi:hypothetical protein GCM10010478_40820 [Streptomyces erythrogriseus]|uniref:DUF2510 domain-containing protein n=1 Tax=Streptomyces erythrogriseus TaxID=284027 RepID=A0ABP6JMZ2_9ACTN
MTPPPGWYPDPHAPHLERWWDGTAWTEHRRTPASGSAPAAGAGAGGFGAPSALHTPNAPGAPGPYGAAGGYGPPAVPGRGGSGGSGGSGGATAVALTAAGAVLVAAVVAGAVALTRDDEDPEARTGPGPTAPAPTTESTRPSPSPSVSEPAPEDEGVVVDELNGVTFPLLDGWVRPRHVVEKDAVMTTDGTHDCPGEGSLCRGGMVVSRTVTATDESSSRVLAEADIPEAAEEAFDEDALGNRPYGGMKSHQVVKAGPVAVAGRAGYLVRWRVTTAKGPGGYVQSLVFPSSVGTESPVLVRFVFEAGPDGPPVADMDRITRGIRSTADQTSGGGVGSSIGPTG